MPQKDESRQSKPIKSDRIQPLETELLNLKADYLNYQCHLMSMRT